MEHASSAFGLCFRLSSRLCVCIQSDNERLFRFFRKRGWWRYHFVFPIRWVRALIERSWISKNIMLAFVEGI